MRLPFHRFVMLLLLPCLSSAGLADERRHRHERHGGGQPIVRIDVHRQHHHRPPIVRHEAHRHHHHRAPHIGSRIVVVSPWHVQPQPVVVLPPIPPPGEYWYYCANPLGYYPYVAVCNVEWQAVPPGFGAPPYR